MSGIQMTTDNKFDAFSVASIIKQIKESQQNVLKDFEEHNNLVNKSLELLNSYRIVHGEMLIEKNTVEKIFIKVKDPLEEIKKLKEEFDKNVLIDTDLEPIKSCTKYWKESKYENSPKNILRVGWIESITFKNCENIKSVSLHFQDRNDISFKYSLKETSNECNLYFGAPDSIRIIDNIIHTSMLPLTLLPYQDIYFTCEKIDETKPCYATMIYGCYDIIVPRKLCSDRIIFIIQDKKLFIRSGMCVTYDNIDLINSIKIQGEYKSIELYDYLRIIMDKILNCLCLYESSKISTTFKEIFLNLFNKCLQFKNESEQFYFNGKYFKESILKVRDIRWLLLEMEKYPQFFQFTEDDLTIMKENGASRDNIYLVKKFLKKDGDYEEMYEEEEGGGIKLQYHMTGGCLNGEYKEYYPDGNLKKETSYKEGLKEGYERVFMNNGDRVMESEYKEDKLHGEHKRYFQNRLILHSHYKDGSLNGEYKGFDIMTGKLEEHCFYKDGKLEGEWARYINGKINILAHYKEGKLHGKYTEYKEDGTYLKECFYTEGKLINLRTYNTSGHLELKKSLINYDTYELSRYYECDGKIHYKVIMEGDKWNGEYKSWWSNGNKCIETTYKDDKIHGDYTYWNQDGTLREKCVYKDGVKV